MGDGMLDVASIYTTEAQKKTGDFLYSILLIKRYVAMKAVAFGALIVI